MKIQVIHKAFEESPVQVAEVNAPDDLTITSALEYAYRWTNNFEGSWSLDDLENNKDANPNVTRVAPLIEYKGKTFGLRSTSMMDLMIVDGKTYEVMGCGFEEIASC